MIKMTWAHVVAAYLVIAAVSYIWIAGLAFANFRAEFPTLNTRRDCLGHVGFALTWSVLAAAAWPAFLPGTYLLFNFGEDGWTFPTPAVCPPRPVVNSRFNVGVLPRP